jgi:hypothetical protein
MIAPLYATSAPHKIRWTGASELNAETASSRAGGARLFLWEATAITCSVRLFSLTSAHFYLRQYIWRWPVIEQLSAGGAHNGIRAVPVIHEGVEVLHEISLRRMSRALLGLGLSFFLLNGQAKHNENGTLPPPPPPPSKGDPLPTDAIFASTSFWYTPIPTQAPVHIKNATYVRQLGEEVAKQKEGSLLKVLDIPENSQGAMFRTADRTTKTRRITWGNAACGTAAGDIGPLLNEWQAVPIPDGVAQYPALHGLTVHRPSSNTLWEYVVVWNNSRPMQTACGGGVLHNVSSSSGIFDPRIGRGAMLTGLPLVGGQITWEELQRGEIRHAIGISVGHPSTSFSWPANGNDMAGARVLDPDGNRIPEGARLRLDPSIDVDALHLTRVATIIAKAAQTYGFVVWGGLELDKSGVTLSARSPESYPSASAINRPYYDVLDPADWAFTADVMRGFPWDRVAFLPADYGKPGPAIAP